MLQPADFAQSFSNRATSSKNCNDAGCKGDGIHDDAAYYIEKKLQC